MDVRGAGFGEVREEGLPVGFWGGVVGAVEVDEED